MKTGIIRFIIERFPLQILAFTTLSTVLASASISTENYDYRQVIVAFTITILFLFHIRVIDENRDFINDSELHPDRPVQRGVISIKSLLFISLVGIILSLTLAFFASLSTFIITLALIVFTTFAAFDFFMPMSIKNKPLIYHIINSPQMLLLQWLIFSIFTRSFSITSEMLLFILLIYNNIFILELVRKINTPTLDSKDSYTAHLGLKKSVTFIVSLAFASLIIYTFLLHHSCSQFPFAFFIGLLITLGIVGVFFFFYIKPQKTLQKIMVLSAVLYYVVMNLLIYKSN